MLENFLSKTPTLKKNNLAFARVIDLNKRTVMTHFYSMPQGIISLSFIIQKISI